MKTFILLLSLVLLASYAVADVSVDKLDVTLGQFTTHNRDSDSTYTQWACDAIVSDTVDDARLSLTVNSDISSGATDFDQLQTWWRVMPAQPSSIAPVFVISTDGTHNFDRCLTTISAGGRKTFRGGFVELTLGAVKDIRTADEWAADLGLLVDYSVTWGNFGFNIRPQGLIGTGEAHLSGGEIRYTVDTRLSYNFDRHLSLNYIFQRNNTQGFTVGTDFIGIGYRR